MSEPIKIELKAGDPVEAPVTETPPIAAAPPAPVAQPPASLVDQVGNRAHSLAVSATGLCGGWGGGRGRATR